MAMNSSDGKQPTLTSVDEQEGEPKKKKQRAGSSHLESTNDPVDNDDKTKKDHTIQPDHQTVYKIDLLPNWIRNSEFIKQFREDYNDEETVELNEDLVFACPLTLNTQPEVLRLLESMRFFGVNNWEIIKLIITFFLDNDDDDTEVGTLKHMFPEFNDLWNNVEFLIDEGLNDSICMESALKGFVYALRYAHENGCPWYEDTCSAAAREGHFNCLQYAHENGCQWDEDTCSAAAREGHFNCLQYAQENGCPWDEDKCSEAASEGHFNCLQYAHENGCQWDEDTCSAADVRDISIVSNMLMRMVVHGMKIHAQRLQVRDISIVSNMLTRMVVH
jgi:hypothetical protein